eukprot:448301-Amphidinium_carterae.1
MQILYGWREALGTVRTSEASNTGNCSSNKQGTSTIQQQATIFLLGAPRVQESRCRTSRRRVRCACAGPARRALKHTATTMVLALHDTESFDRPA